MENTEEKSWGNKYLKNLSGAQLQNINHQWNAQVYNGKSDQNVPPIKCKNINI